MNEIFYKEKYRTAFANALKQMPLAGFGKGFNDRALPRAVGMAKRAGLSSEETFQRIYATQAKASRETTHEINSTIERIFESDTIAFRNDKAKWPEFNSEASQNVINESSFTLTDLVSQSPVKNVDALKSHEVLAMLFEGDPIVTVGRKRTLNGTTVIPGYSDLVSRLAVKGERYNEFIVPSPAIKKRGKRKDGKLSNHCDEMYPNRAYLVVESDRHASKDEQSKIIWHLASFAPLVMVVDSGGKSLHGWFDCAQASETDVRRFFSYAIRLGADERMAKTMQFARMPNGVRSVTNAKQAVRYWNPEAKGGEWNLTELPSDSLTIRSILDLPTDADEGAVNLLGNRYLCRGKGIMLVGPTGVGKSTLAVQGILTFACGKDFFGLKPIGPLRSLYIQAENDDYELRDAVLGIVNGLEFSDEDREQADRNVFRLTCGKNAVDLLKEIEPQIEKFKPDLLVLDPLFAFHKADLKDQQRMSEFLRDFLQPFLEKHSMACLIVHHTNKPPGTKKDRAEWSPTEYAYAGSGSAELANWCKAVMVISAIGSEDVFKLMLGKRAKRAGIVDETGKLLSHFCIKHASNGDSQFWSLATEEEAETATIKDIGRKMATAFVKLAGATSGVITKKELASELETNTRAIDRVFQDKNPFRVPQPNGGWLILERKNGKIFGCEESKDGGIRAKACPSNAGRESKQRDKKTRQ